MYQSIAVSSYNEMYLDGDSKSINTILSSGASIETK
jgi:hypothetical protein